MVQVLAYVGFSVVIFFVLPKIWHLCRPMLVHPRHVRIKAAARGNVGTGSLCDGCNPFFAAAPL